MVNVVDLMRLETPSEHPHGMSDAEFGVLFTKDKPVIFAYRGYPCLPHMDVDRLPAPRRSPDGYPPAGPVVAGVLPGPSNSPAVASRPAPPRSAGHTGG